LTITGNTQLIKGVTSLRMTANYSFYDADDQGNVINELYARNNRGLLRFERATLAFSNRISVKQLRGFFNKDQEQEERGGGNPNQRSQQPNRQTASLAEGGSILDLLNNYSISHELRLEKSVRDGRDTFFVQAHNLRLTGNLRITSKWSINITQISYDFKTNRFVYPDLGFTRDLHCWQMSMNWQPDRNAYNFTINVKPGSFFDKIKIPYNKNNVDGRTAF